MKKTLLGLAVIALSASVAAATPNPTNVVFNLRVFNDCPTTTLETYNNYPSEIWIDDQNNDCFGYANLHNWHLSEDGVNEAVFNNNSNFRLAFDMVLDGTGHGEGGLQIAPWWSKNADGKFNCRTSDGEIACFGGRLPFYSFTGNHGLLYTRGTMIHLEAIYLANELTEQNPATVEYKITYMGNDYTSGPLAFDMGNPNEPYGLWGMLDDGRVGAFVQPFNGQGTPVGLRGTWTNVVFENLDPPTATESTSWGKVKALFH